MEKHIINYLRYTIFGLLLLSALTSCKKYLDVTPDNVGTLEYAFRNRNEAENYLFTCYAYLQRSSKSVTDLAFTTSSEIIYPNDLNSRPIEETGFNLIRGTQNSNSPALNAWDGQNDSYSYFRSIRNCNIMLENIDQPFDLSAAEKQRWIAEVKFLKAYYHYELLRRYGPVPIIRENLPISSGTEETRVKRMPVDSVFNYIVSLLDEAVPDLPDVIQNQARELGRITRLIALSVKAEVLATAASPLFNGNLDYTNFKDKDDVFLFSQSYDASKWERAAEAALAAIQACEAEGMRLYTYNPPGTIGSLTDSLRRVLTLQNAVTERWELNDELIWALSPEFDYQGYCIPRMTSASAINIFSNPSTFAVPISTEELFYTEHGIPMNEDRTWDYASRYDLRVAESQDRYYVKEGYTTVKAHFNREPRFYANIGFDGGVWFGNGVLNQNDPLYVQARGTSGLAGPKDRNTINISGYWPKKIANYLSVYDDGFEKVAFRMPKMRLAGLYLLYAEVLNESVGPNATVLEYVNSVRSRAGLPTVEEAWSTYSRNATKYETKEGMREIIHRERRIELCFEAQSGWDLRRWKEMQGVLSRPLQGWNVYEEQPLNYYRARTLVMPVFGIKDYLMPLREQNLVVNPNLVQNPYW